MEHISPQSLMTYSTHSSVSPDPMFAMDNLFCPPTHTLSVTKPVKKRKSWGQELPEPKTNLPPRKRAKTEDEKEQRRIERIKRNRAAAHNSRERKRQEAEGLAVANEKLLAKMKEMQHMINIQSAQLEKCKEQLGGSLPAISEEDQELFERRYSNQSTGSSSSAHSPSSTIDPRASLSCSTPATSPENTPYIKMEDNMPSDNGHESLTHESLFAALNPTQHSAAMLCDLQCRLSAAASSLLVQSTSQTWVWTRTILYLTHLSVMTTYKTILLAFWTQSPTQMNKLLATLIRSSTLTLPRPQSTTAFPTPLPRWSTLAQLVLLATGLPSSVDSALALIGERKCEWSIVSRSMRSLLDQGPGGFVHSSDNSIAKWEKVNHDGDDGKIRDGDMDSKNVLDNERGFVVDVPPPEQPE
ncbi:hypothetical protein BDZ85DRAFT_293433 [Elsinoe ampelina]|uniref:BZIP domain-containing protein n=1 Tax=Elsinoe ampelina TaxID=302913 RepID=A0A6A6GLC9_9PEZI|nr:hypothetical protein BDZ85DRAFT_293433 [Elsinoe ampelina]